MCNEINWTSETKIFHLPPWTLTSLSLIILGYCVNVTTWLLCDSVEAKVTSIAIRGAENSLCSGPTILNCSKCHNYMTRPFLFSSFSLSLLSYTHKTLVAVTDQRAWTCECRTRASAISEHFIIRTIFISAVIAHLLILHFHLSVIYLQYLLSILMHDITFNLLSNYYFKSFENFIL